MNTSIHPYNQKNIDTISRFLCNYRDTSDYRYLFSSKEWLSAFIDVYSPKENFLVLSKNERDYFSLSVFNNQIVFTGDPFNDYNGTSIDNSDAIYDFKKIMRYFIDLGYQIKWTNLFEQNLLEDLRTNGIGTLQEADASLKIPRPEDTQSYDHLVSSRILRMYNKFSNGLSFYRVFGAEIYEKPYLLKTLLSSRQEKLITKKSKEYNRSFEPEFNKFIVKLVSFDSLSENVFLDYSVERETNELLAMSLNFMNDKHIICYLRFHIPSSNAISYGLILDYWSNCKNFREGIDTIDLTRGNESYKYRLGSVEYRLKNFVIL